ncbi:excisionase family DNA-binding protein [Xylanimonas protaetiae]|uniref:Helix-turn-helix domain-containing protein n=1 Tax=Xylanimonas protaetiae TaxID=2509457 RepID=A0A4P6F230_9MICO|nr:excisionase family DNA-binding protein [Xylanimonas protaetiae]QAY69236.1 helix-turn-helix domain-containing protein [Xylanimonas protaetiae]
MTKREPLAVSEVAPVLCDVNVACKALGIHRTILYELIRCGALRTVKIGTRRLVPIAALKEYAESLDGAA